MGEKDIIEKTLMGFDDVFADIINGLIYKGKEVIGFSELIDAQPVSYYKTSQNTINSQERDIIKKWQRNKTTVAMLSIENQSSICPYMPVRVIGYDGSAYRKQLADHESSLRISKKTSTSLTRDQSAINGIEAFNPVPVVTLILYFGKTHWKHNRRLKEMLDVSEQLLPYVNDYKINIFEIACKRLIFPRIVKS